jgi:LPXTG-motif cell wall-anchored protein
MTWVLIVIGVIIVLGLVYFLVRKRREQQLEENRAQAGELRQTADTRERKAEQARLAAEEQAERARKEQAAADEHRRQAAEVDPDVDTDDDSSS